MTTISIYDDTAEKLEQAAEQRDTSVAELIDELITYLEEEE